MINKIKNMLLHYLNTKVKKLDLVKIIIIIIIFSLILFIPQSIKVDYAPKNTTILVGKLQNTLFIKISQQ